VSAGAGGEVGMAETALRHRDVFDTRPTLAREGGREVAMDDHGVRRIPATWRWGYVGATFTAAGVSTAMIYPLSGALYTINYGAKAALIAAAITAVYACITCYYVIRHVVNEGINADLLSRSTFGYIGSAFNAILYATVCGFLFAAEGSVMAHALAESVPAIPYWGWALLTNASFVLLGLFGMVLLTKVQWATLVFYFAGLAVAVWALLQGWDERVSLTQMHGWWRQNPNGVPLDGWTILEATSSYIGVLGAILAVFTTDVARFMRREQRGFGGMFFVAVNTIIPVVLMYVTGIMMLAASGQPDPGVTLVRLIGGLGLAVTLITQVRINLLNLYGGTLGLANFFSRIFGYVPGRQFWAIPFLVVATGIILTPFREHFGQITIYISVFLCAWVSTLIGERALVRRAYGLPTWSEVRRAYLPDYNVVGLVSMWVPVAIGCVMASGVLGRHVRALAVPFCIAVPFVLPGLLAAMLGPVRLVRAYVGRDMVVPPQHMEVVSCGRCQGEYHRSDFALCPFHQGIWICSYCCMSELQCGTVCRTDAAPVVRAPLLHAE
jgi:purine-cytosine permease-like protein